MKASPSLGLAFGLLFGLTAVLLPQDTGDDPVETHQDAAPQAFLESLVGSWEGTCRT